MSFVHNTPEFSILIDQVSDTVNVAPALVEKDVVVELDVMRQDKYARSADYIGRYPGTHFTTPL